MLLDRGGDPYMPRVDLPSRGKLCVCVDVTVLVITVMGTPTSFTRNSSEIPLVGRSDWQLRVLARYPAPHQLFPPVRTVSPRLMGLLLQAGIVPLSGGGFGSRNSVAIECQEPPRAADEVAEEVK